MEPRAARLRARGRGGAGAIPHSPGDKRYQAFAWRDAFAGAPFEPLRQELYPNREEITADQLVARIGSWSNLTTLAPDVRAAWLARIRDALTEPTYRFELDTHAWYTRRA